MHPFKKNSPFLSNQMKGFSIITNDKDKIWVDNFCKTSLSLQIVSSTDSLGPIRRVGGCNLLLHIYYILIVDTEPLEVKQMNNE